MAFSPRHIMWIFIARPHAKLYSARYWCSNSVRRSVCRTPVFVQTAKRIWEFFHSLVAQLS